MTRVLILGATGMLGHKLAQGLDAVDLTCTARVDTELPGVDRRSIVAGIDATDIDGVTAVIDSVEPDVVINCIGIIKQLAAARQALPSITVNSLFPHQLAAITSERGARLVHFSTDCVFSGERGAYSEEDTPDPIDLYGRSKLLGEVDAPNALTLRTSIIGRELGGSSSLVEWFLSQDGGTANGFRKAIYSGITTNEMVRVVRGVIEDHPTLSGVHHVSSEPIDKYELLCLLRDSFSMNIDVTAVDEPVIDRSLISERFRSAAGWKPPSWEEMVDEMAADPIDYRKWRT